MLGLNPFDTEIAYFLELMVLGGIVYILFKNDETDQELIGLDKVEDNIKWEK